MLRKLIRNKKAQNTAEYAILIALVVAAIIAMQTYAQRALQARVRDASKFMSDTISEAGGAVGNSTVEMGSTQQYEPYYLSTNYTVNRDENTTQRLDTNLVRTEENSTRTRMKDGEQKSTYQKNLMIDETTNGFK